jgi:predicted XRE-type DNA-binding protein
MRDLHPLGGQNSNYPIDNCWNLQHDSRMDISKLIEKEQAALRKKLELLSGNNIAALLEEKKGLQAKIAELDAKIKLVADELGLELPDEGAAPKERRTRLSGDEISRRILELLKAHPEGLSQAAISEATGVSYPSVINFIKDNADKISSQGERRTKRVFLKQ